MKKYRAAVVGCGFIGIAHVEALRRLGNVDVVAICATHNSESKAQEIGIEKGYADYRKMIDEMHLDSIHICTPNATHYDIAKYAIEHGVNVVCEKPFTTTIEQARELVSLAKKNGVKGYVNFHNRFYSMPNQLHYMVRNGDLGRVFSIHGEYIQDWLLYETDYSWRLEKSKVGNTRAVADIGSHWLDLAEFTTGLRITEVNALFSTVYSTRKKPEIHIETFSDAGKDAIYTDVPVDTEDIALILMKFNNGAVGSLSTSQVFAGKKNTTILKVAGSNNSAIWNSEYLNELTEGHRSQPNEQITKGPDNLYPNAERTVSYPAGHVEGFPDAFKHGFAQFYSSLNSDSVEEYDYATFEDGLRDVVLCEAIFESAQTGTWVKIKEGCETK